MDFNNLKNNADLLYSDLFGYTPIPIGEKQVIIVQLMLLLKQTPVDILTDRDIDTQKQIDEVIKRGRKASNTSGT